VKKPGTGKGLKKKGGKRRRKDEKRGKKGGKGEDSWEGEGQGSVQE